MKIELVEEGSSLRHLDVELETERLAEEYEKGVARLRRTVKLPGFRKGKIPAEVIRRKFHSDVLSQAVQDLVSQTLAEALRERELYPLGDPRISDLESELGKPVRFRASFEVMPKVEASDYEGLEATERKTDVTEEQVDAGVEQLREQNARFDPVEGRGAQDHDFVMGDLTETGPDVPDGGEPRKHEGVTIEVGSEAYHAKLHEALQGAEAGADVAFTAAFPADHPDPERAGKTFEASFLVHEVKEKVLPAADDELAKDLGDFDTLDEVRAELRKQGEARAKHEDEQDLRGQLLDQLVARNPFDPPSSLVDYEVESRLQSAAQDLQRRGVDPAQAGVDWNALRTEQRASAEAAVKATLLLDSIVEQEKIEETEEELTAEIGRAAEALSKGPEAVRAQMMKDGTLDRIRSRLRREKAVDFIKSHAKLK